MQEEFVFSVGDDDEDGGKRRSQEKYAQRLILIGDELSSSYAAAEPFLSYLSNLFGVLTFFPSSSFFFFFFLPRTLEKKILKPKTPENPFLFTTTLLAAPLSCSFSHFLSLHLSLSLPPSHLLQFSLSSSSFTSILCLSFAEINELASCFPTVRCASSIGHSYRAPLIGLCLVADCTHCWSCSFRRSIHKYGADHPKCTVLQSRAFQHWFKNWQELRKNKLTASTFGQAIGLFPHRRVQLWLEKLGAIEPFTGNLATCWNNIKEEEALERYKLITGNTVLFPEFQVLNTNYEEEEWLAASPDGLVLNMTYELPSRGVLEIKCPFFGGDMSEASPWKRIPLYYMPQAQGLMKIMDKDWMDFYCWTVRGSSLFRIYRDEEYWDALRIALSDFWWKHVKPAKELCENYVIIDPLIQLRELKPEPRHELCSDLVLESHRLVDNSKLLMREIDGRFQH